MMDYFDKTVKTISDSLNSIDPKMFEKLSNDCIETLKNNKKIVITGLGKNVPVCEKFVGTLWSLGLDAAFLHTNDAAHGDLGMIRDGDLVIVLSKSGETQETIYLMEHLRQREICDWAITFAKDNSLAKMASNTIRLSLDNEGDQWNLVPNNSTTVYLILLQGLIMEITKAIGVKRETFKKNHPGGSIGRS